MADAVVTLVGARRPVSAEARALFDRMRAGAASASAEDDVAVVRTVRLPAP